MHWECIHLRAQKFLQGDEYNNEGKFDQDNLRIAILESKAQISVANLQQLTTI